MAPTTQAEDVTTSNAKKKVPLRLDDSEAILAYLKERLELLQQ